MPFWCSFHHFCFNSRALNHSLNWTSNQSSHSRRRPQRRFNMLNCANSRWRVEQTKKTSLTDAFRCLNVGRQPTVGLECPGLKIYTAYLHLYMHINEPKSLIMILKKERVPDMLCVSYTCPAYIMQGSQHMNGIIVCTYWTETQESILMSKNYTCNL